MEHKVILNAILGVNLRVDDIGNRYGIKLNLSHLLTLHCIQIYNDGNEKCGEKHINANLKENRRRKSPNLVNLIIRHLLSNGLISLTRSHSNDTIRKFYHLTKTGKMLLNDFTSLLLNKASY